MLKFYDDSVISGSGVFIDANGRLVDEATVRGARRTLARAGKSAVRGA